MTMMSDEMYDDGYILAFVEFRGIVECITHLINRNVLLDAHFTLDQPS
jgi:hypothetical protein